MIDHFAYKLLQNWSMYAYMYVHMWDGGAIVSFVLILFAHSSTFPCSHSPKSIL
jgi:hypothetical protein